MRPWSDSEVEILEARYPVEDDLEVLAEVLERSVRAIERKANAMKIKRVPPVWRNQWRWRDHQGEQRQPDPVGRE
jgi:hypothetical protein